MSTEPRIRFRNAALALLLLGCGASQQAAPKSPAQPPEPPPPPRAQGEFEDALQAVLGELQPKLALADQLTRAGKISESDELVLGAVPRESWNGVHYFVFGNLLFGQRDDLALEFLTQAWRAYPDEPRINLEYALIQHRMGHCAAALDPYARALSSEGMPPQWHALHADCLLREGRSEEAVRAWMAASHETAQSAIDFAVHAVYGEPRPIRRWYALRERIAAGELELASELVRLDTRWDQDWWNAERNEPQLRADLEWLAGLEGMDARELDALRLYAELMRPRISAEEVRAAFEKSGLVIGPAGALPRDSSIASGLFVAALDHGVSTREALYAAHAPELRRRSEEDGDVEALNGLAFLSAGRPAQELIELERGGWERHHDARFAAGLLGLLGAQKKLAQESKLVSEIDATFPDDAKVQAAVLEAAISSGRGVREAYVKAALAEFRSLSRGTTGMRTSERLDTLMHGLRVELGVPLPPPVMQARYELRGLRLVGDQLHAVLETYVTFRAGKDSRAKDFRAYLVVADLTSDTPAVRVYGPLWEVARERSALSYEAGPMFTEDDRAAAAAHPRFAFGDDGRLVIWNVAGQEGARALELAEASARLVALPAPAKPFDPAEGTGTVLLIDRMRTLRKTKQGWRLVTAPSGEVTRDGWLEQVARDVEKRMGADLGDSSVLMDPARGHVLLVPTDAWTRTDAAKPEAQAGAKPEEQKPEVVTAFRLGGREYPRKEHGLHYRRPKRAPSAYARPPARGAWRRTDHVVVVGDEPMALVRDGEGLRLSSISGDSIHALSSAAFGSSVGMNRIDAARYDAARGVLRLGASWLTPGQGPLGNVLAVIDWNLERGEAHVREIAPAAFLAEQDGALVPMEAVARPLLAQ